MNLADLELQEQSEEPQIISRKVLREQVKEILVERILLGEFAPGDRLVETRIARELGVSQGTVRESIREMEWMGFLETEPYSGTYVKAISLDDLKRLYPIRAALESLGARMALPNLNAEALAALEALVDEMVRVSEEGDERGMVERNYTFHKAIMLASQNEYLIQCWSMFQFSYWTSVSTAPLRHMLVYLARRHYSIVEALRTGDSEIAARAMEKHVDELMEQIERRQAEIERKNE